MKVDKSDFFKGDPYRSALQPIFDDYRDEIREKAKVFFKGWKGNLRGWHRYLWNCHAFHNTLEDEKGGFHFFVNTRYIPLEPLLNKIRKAGMDIEQVKVNDKRGARLFGDEDGPDHPEVFVRVVKTRRKHETA